MVDLSLEDTVADILGKAQRGLSLSDEVLAERATLPISVIKALKHGEYDEDALTKVAVILDLGINALKNLATKSYSPPQITSPNGLASFQSCLEDIKVNSYLVWDPLSREGAFFDTGADADDMLEFAEKHDLRMRQLFITHIHSDHIYDMDRLIEKTGAQAWVCEREAIDGAHPFAPGETFVIGNLMVATRRTSGHSLGGITYVVTGLCKPLAIVGDALFAGSMGNAFVSYTEALQTNQKEILTLSSETILCPGHGPLTTVRAEKLANPFFAKI